MRTGRQLTLALPLLCAASLQIHGQQAGSANSIKACSLLSNAEVAKETGRRLFSAPEPTSLAGGAGSACTFDIAQLVLYSGDKAEQNWEAYLKNFHHDQDKRHPISGLGERAYVLYPKPRDQYEDTNAVVVVKQHQHVIAVSVAAEQNKPAESVQPHAIALAKLVLAKLN